jgi:2-aminoadipate transaminase
MQDISLSNYGKESAIPSPANNMMNSFAADFREGTDINLGVGYVNDKTIPQNTILNSLKTVINDPVFYRSAFNYGGPAGSANLINSLKKFITRNNIGNITKELLDSKKIIVGASSVTSLLESIAQVVKPGIVITTDPMYYIYCNFLERAGFKLVTIPEDKDGIQTDLLKEKLKTINPDDISFFYIVTIGNPSASILSNERRKEIVNIVSKTSKIIDRKIPLIWDAAYENLVHDQNIEKLVSALTLDDNGLVYELGTMSKILAPGIRVGYMIGEDSDFMNAMIQRTSDIGFSGPLMNQEIVSHILDEHIEDQLKKVNEGYKQKSAILKPFIEEELGEYLEELIGGSASFYFYMTFKDIKTGEDSDFYKFCTRITQNTNIDFSGSDKKPRVVYIPGEFCVNPNGDMKEKGSRQFRISYGFEDVDIIKNGISIFKEAAKYAKSRKDNQNNVK